MLVLTRKIGQAILVLHDIKIIVLGTDGDRVKIGIEAPKWVPILREELLERRTSSEMGTAIA